MSQLKFKANHTHGVKKLKKSPFLSPLMQQPKLEFTHY